MSRATDSVRVSTGRPSLEFEPTRGDGLAHVRFTAATRATGWWIAALVVAAVAVVLPVRSLAGGLAGGQASPERLADLVTGLWLLKGALLLHALVIAVAPYIAVPTASTPGLAPDAASRADVRLSPRDLGLLVLLCGVALALRIPSLDRGLWIDEIEMFVKHVRLPLAQLVSTLDSQNQHMLYSVLSRFALSAGLSDGWAMRLPAVLFGVASIVAVVWFGIRVTTRHEAWAAAAILTASYHHVWFSQNARGYTGLLFLTIVGSGCFLALLARPGQHTRRWVAAYAVTMALAHLVHITAAFVTAAHGLIWLALAVSQRRSLRDRAWLTPLTALALTATLTFLLYALVLPQLVGTLMAPTDGGSAGMWKSPWWLVTETLRVLGNGVPGGLVSVGIALGVVLFGVVSYVKQSRALGAVMLLPLVCTAVILLATTHNLWPRFFFFGAAFIVLIALRGGFAIARQLLPRHGLTLATVAAFGVAVLSAFTVPRAWGPKQDYAGALAFVDAKSIPTDGFAGVDMTGLVYTRYYQRPWANLTSADELTRLEASHARTWVVVTFPSRLSVIQPAMWDHLTRSYRTIATFPGTVGGGAIMVMVNR